MSVLHEEWGGSLLLPSIGEDSNLHARLLTPMGRRRSGSMRSVAASDSVSLPRRHSTASFVSAYDDAAIQKELEAIGPVMQRRRFHSSDVILRRGSGRSGNGNGSFAYHGRGSDSPTLALRHWGGSPSRSCSELSPAQILRQRQRRRAHSDMNAKLMGGTNGIKSSYATDLSPWYMHEEESTHTQHENSPRQELPSDLDSESEVESGSDRDHTRWRSRSSCSEDSNQSSAASSSSYYSHSFARSYASTDYEPQGNEKLMNLQKLYQEGFITVTEYKNRRLQLVDELSVTDKTIKRTTDLIQTDLPVIHREPPDFTLLRERDAIKHVFDSENRKWTSSRIQVKIDPEPFARGGLRQVFHLQDLSVIPQLGSNGRPMSYVAKIAIDPNENPDTYFRDVEMQAVASMFAELYNSYYPPRRVEFLEAWILQLIPAGETGNLTMSGTICGVEPYIAGEYHKHNNNFGYVSELERNTPQTFSHFTYEASGREMLIVDIQGVADHYTDPQIHTRSGKEFGKGNLAVRGFERFLASHRCNPICRYLKLPLINPKDDADVDEDGHAQIDPKGTVPAQTYMSQARISVRRVDSELCHYYGDSKAFKKYQAKHQQHQDHDAESARSLIAVMQDQRNCASFCGVSACSIS
ncbi:hypothetical protein Poli38472_008224 [Pythium oligandrum]|uniref:Alpha-type protein kinase domain-containing protein n=1 Tax=Pythium oligandrum TaxID=41045 RepID=A0A8K1FN75_PYTOL|nr:hypothetical protein Poli38472_008224 [Pythium oligandrum]|eukprot:TMW65582.1 hypothetical protein Poli38472_008224 [Pythium oligandrum]